MFISIENTLQEAMAYRTSPRMTVYSFEGIQLLPNQINPYKQRTYGANGIEVENYDGGVWVTDVCTGVRLLDITDSFYSTNFNDITGLPQIEWSLTNIPFDGQQLIYLEIVQGNNVTFYSTPFYISSYEADYTARIDYRDNPALTMYSTQLRLWFKQPSQAVEVSTYKAVTSGRQLTINSTVTDFELWQSSVIDIYLFAKLNYVFRNLYTYVDLVRTDLYEPYEYPVLEAGENFAEAEILFTRNFADVYDPLYVQPIPEPEPPIPSITLIQIQLVGTSQVQFTNFTYENIGMPTSLTYQISTDGVFWNDYTNGVNPPITITPNPAQYAGYDLFDLFYRIRDNATGTVSNVLQLPVRSAVINNVISLGLGKTDIYFTLNSFVPLPGTYLQYQASYDGTTWVNFNPSPMSNTSPVTITLPSLSFDKFKIIYAPYGVVSNVFEL